jgi:hypothetical protein
MNDQPAHRRISEQQGASKAKSPVVAQQYVVSAGTGTRQDPRHWTCTTASTLLETKGRESLWLGGEVAAVCK